MTKTLLWTNPSITSLGDRLLDTMLLATFSKMLGADLHFPWVDCPFTIGQENPTYTYKEGENKEWDRVRFEDYKFENYTQYYNLPSNIKINQPIETPTYFFGENLGGCVSPFTFYNRYLSQVCKFDDFIIMFKQTLSEFTPTEKLLKLVENRVVPDVSVHLRRTDKINKDGDYTTFMTYDGLDTLNEKTKEAINLLYDNRKSFYFSSDDLAERDKYHELYPYHIEHDTTCSAIEKTYIDLYMLSKSNYIILSQVHSNFSVFASYLNGGKLVYLYDNCLIVNENFNATSNFIHYQDLLPNKYNEDDLIKFEEDIAECFNNAQIKAPIHLYFGNEKSMIEVFSNIKKSDWIFCTWRSHYQCLLKGVPEEQIKKDILDGKSITLCYPEQKIYSSAIVGGNIPIATGVALDIKRKGGKEHVWCFVGDMAAETGTFYENWKYSVNHDLPITFIIENNGKSVCTDTLKTWNSEKLFFGAQTKKIIYYEYQNKYPHAGSGKRIQF